MNAERNQYAYISDKSTKSLQERGGYYRLVLYYCTMIVKGHPSGSELLLSVPLSPLPSFLVLLSPPLLSCSFSHFGFKSPHSPQQRESASSSSLSLRQEVVVDSIFCEMSFVSILLGAAPSPRLLPPLPLPLIPALPRDSLLLPALLQVRGGSSSSPTGPGGLVVLLMLESPEEAE